MSHKFKRDIVMVLFVMKCDRFLEGKKVTEKTFMSVLKRTRLCGLPLPHADELQQVTCGTMKFTDLKKDIRDFLCFFFTK